MPSSFFWYELMTTDVPSAENFYKNVVGWDAAPFGGNAMDYIVFSAADRGVAGLMRIPEEAKGTPPAWIGYIHATDVDAATESLRNAGGSVHREPADIPAVGRFSVVADPEGATFMLMAPMGPDQPAVPPNTLGHVGWHELYAANYERAFDFYSGQFGWTKQRDFDMGAMGTYRIFSAGGGEDTGGMMNRPNGLPVSFWQFYFTVPDIDSAALRIADNGGTITFGPMQVPGGSWVVNAQDPQGAHFALVADKKS